MKAPYETDSRQPIWMSGFAFVPNYATDAIVHTYPPRMAMTTRVIKKASKSLV